MAGVIWHAPNATGYNSPAPIRVTTSGVYNTALYPGWAVFKETLQTGASQMDCWAERESVTRGWVAIDFGKPTYITVYKLHIRGRYANPAQYAVASMARSWTLQGSDDGVNWVVIDTRTNVNNWNITTLREQEFQLSTPANYRHYKLDVTQNNGWSGWMAIGLLRFGFTARYSAFLNLDTGKYYVVNDSGIQEIDGSESSISSQGMEAGYTVRIADHSEFESLIGLQPAIISYAELPPVITVDRAIQQRESLVSSPIFLSGVKSLDKITASTTGGVLHTLSKDNGSRWLYFNGVEWVESLNDTQGMSTSVMNGLSPTQLSMLFTEGVNSISFKHSFVENATITSVLLTGTMEGALSLANGFTQSYDPSTKTVTFRVTAAGKYKINYVDTD